MLKIGITGGIGSGKTTVCGIFSQLGIPVYSSDIRAKELMQEDEELISQLKDQFGKDIYADNELDRKKLADIVFSDKQKLELLNSLVHPVVLRDYQIWTLKQETAYVIKEAALMFESGSYKDQDYIINVTAPEELRIKRVMERDNASREQVIARMRNQLSEQERLDRSDFVLTNDGKESLIRQVMELHRYLLDLSKLH